MESQEAQTLRKYARQFPWLKLVPQEDGSELLGCKTCMDDLTIAPPGQNQPHPASHFNILQIPDAEEDVHRVATRGHLHELQPASCPVECGGQPS